jgi:hypothetical protein
MKDDYFRPISYTNGRGGLPPPNRIGKSDGERKHHLYEGAVMVA